MSKESPFHETNLFVNNVGVSEYECFTPGSYRHDVSYPYTRSFESRWSTFSQKDPDDVVRMTSSVAPFGRSVRFVAEK